MMDLYLYALLTFFYVVLWIVVIRQAQWIGWGSLLNVILLVIVGLIYDNGILTVGRFIGESSWLEKWNELRYWLHAFFTPLLVLYSYAVLKRINVHFAQHSLAKLATFLITACLISVEIIGILTIDLEPVWEYGILSYQETEDRLPIMVIAISIILLLTSIIVWRKTGFYLFFVGCLIISVTSIVQLPIPTKAMTNIGEAILLLSLVLTNYYLSRTSD